MSGSDEENESGINVPILSSCRCLSTFRVCKCGEAKALSKCMVENLHNTIKKSLMLEQFPANLSQSEQWLPGFKLKDSPVAPHLPTKVNTTADNLSEWQEQCSSLARVWWNSVLIPAVHSYWTTPGYASLTQSKRLKTHRFFLYLHVSVLGGQYATEHTQKELRR